MTTLHKLAAEYHRRTEAYDRTVCTGPIVRGYIQPRGNSEFVLVNRHAMKVYHELQARAVAAGFTKRQFRDAMARHLP